MIYNKQAFGTYTLHTIKTDKFRQCHIEIVFRNNVKKENITKRNVLFDYLCEVSKDYSTKKDLEIKLEDLYNASVYAVTSRIGASLITNLCIDFINPEYTEKGMLDESIKLIFDLLFNPLYKNNEFNEKVLELIKNRLKDEINLIKENSKKHSLNEAKRYMPETPSAYNSLGYLEDLEDITPENIYKYYEEIIKNDYVDIIVVGNLDMDEVSKLIHNYAKFNIIKTHQVDLYVNNPKMKEQIVSKPYNYVQTSIVMVLNLMNLTPYEKKYVSHIYNIILGGGSLESKLYKKLRTENSLCYNVNSYYQKYDGLIYITTGVDVNAKDKAIKLVKDAIKDMVKDISDAELEQAKMFIQTSLNMIMDSIGKIADNKYFESISDLDDFETRIKTFKGVTKEDLYEFSKKVSVGLIFSLDGGTNE